MSQMNLHFAVRFLIIGIALIYVVGPMFGIGAKPDQRARASYRQGLS